MPQLELYEFGDAACLPPEVSPVALKKYLKQVWQNRHGWYRYPEEELLPVGNQQPFLQFDSTWIQARNYSGIIHFQGVTFYLIPKVFNPASDSPATKGNRLLSHVAFYLSYCRHVRFPFQWQFTESAPVDTLQHWIHLFASFTASTLTQQPYLAYQTQTNETAYLKGKLAVQSYLSQQISRGQWQRLQTEQQPFELNNLFNQIVKHTAKRLQTLADVPTQSFLDEILWLLTDVDDIPCTVADCEAVHLNRLYPNHQQILDMCRFFLAGESAGDSYSQTMNFAFLVPMDQIFEDFVAGFIQKYFTEWRAEFQKSMPIGRRNQSKTIFTRTDVWLPLQNTLLDTKYKVSLLDNQLRNVASADLYQMLAYASVYQVQNVHLLYPGYSSHSPQTIECFLENRSIWVHLHALPFVLTDATDSFPALILRLKESLQNIGNIS